MMPGLDECNGTITNVLAFLAQPSPIGMQVIQALVLICYSLRCLSGSQFLHVHDHSL